MALIQSVCCVSGGREVPGVVSLARTSPVDADCWLYTLSGWEKLSRYTELSEGPSSCEFASEALAEFSVRHQLA